MALFDESVRLVANVGAGPNLFVATFEAPRLSEKIAPGQFVHMGIPGMDSHILRRPFSVYRRDRKAETVDILYQTVGFGTKHLSDIDPEGALADAFSLVGPIGKGWDRRPKRRRGRCWWAGAWAPRLCSCLPNL